MKLLRFLAPLLAFAATLMLTSNATSAASGPSPAVLQLSTAPSLNAKGHKIKGQLLIVAKLTAADGTPLSKETVAYYERVTFAGAEREAALGTAVTDATGVAAIVYQPAQAGKHTLTVHFAGNGGATNADANSTIQVTDVVPLFPATTAPLASVRHWLSIAVLLIVVAVWVFLLGLVLRVVFGIRSAGDVSMVPDEVPEYLRTSPGD